MAGLVIPEGISVRTHRLMKSHVATRPSGTCIRAGNDDIHAIFRLTLDVITQNLTVTLGTALSETLKRPVGRKPT